MSDMKSLARRVKELEDQLVVCIRCGTCQSVCPLFEQTHREADVARGKLALLDGLGKNMFADARGVDERLNRCLLCGSCAANCPSGVNVVEIFIKARIILAEYKGLSPAKKLIFQKVLANPETFDFMTEMAEKFQNVFTRKEENPQQTSCARVISPLLDHRHFPAMAQKSFHRLTPQLNTPRGKSGIKVAFFTGCIIDKVFPRIANDAVEVFAHHGIGCYIPDGQGCCGIPSLASGDRKTFEKLVDHHMRLFSREKFDYLVTACATCTSTIKKLWPSMYEGEGSGIRARIRAISDKTLDINQFLVNNIHFFSPDDRSEGTGERTGGTGAKITYHDPCHLKKSLGVADEPRALIKWSGHELVEMEGADRCCGMGGSFNLYHYKISAGIGNLKQQNIVDTGCDILATGCPACMVQISDMLAKNGAQIKVAHPLELYAEYLRNR